MSRHWKKCTKIWYYPRWFVRSHLSKIRTISRKLHTWYLTDSIYRSLCKRTGLDPKNLKSGYIPDQWKWYSTFLCISHEAVCSCQKIHCSHFPRSAIFTMQIWYSKGSVTENISGQYHIQVSVLPCILSLMLWICNRSINMYTVGYYWKWTLFVQCGVKEGEAQDSEMMKQSCRGIMSIKKGLMG